MPKICLLTVQMMICKCKYCYSGRYAGRNLTPVAGSVYQCCLTFLTPC